MPDPILGYQKQEIIAAAIFPIGYNLSNYTTAGDFQTQCDIFYDEALNSICHANDWRFLHDVYTWSQAASDGYDLAANSVYVDDIEALFITTLGKGRRVIKGDWKTFLRQDPSHINTGDAIQYDRWNDSQLIFDRVIQENCDFKMLYKKSIPMQTVKESYPIIARRYQPNIRNYIRWKVVSEKGDRRSQQFFDEYEEKLMKDISYEQSPLDTGDARIQQPSEYDLWGGYQTTMRDVLNRVFG